MLDLPDEIWDDIFLRVHDTSTSRHEDLLAFACVSKLWNARVTLVRWRHLTITWLPRQALQLEEVISDKPALLPLVRSITIDMPLFETWLEARYDYFVTESRKARWLEFRYDRLQHFRYVSGRTRRGVIPSEERCADYLLGVKEAYDARMEEDDRRREYEHQQRGYDEAQDKERLVVRAFAIEDAIQRNQMDWLGDLTEEWSWWTGKYHDQNDEERIEGMVKLSQFLGQLPSLREATLSVVHCSEECSLPILPRLQVLRLHDTLADHDADPYEQVRRQLRLLDMTPNIHKLDLDIEINADRERDIHRPDFVIPNLPHLRSLSITVLCPGTAPISSSLLRLVLSVVGPDISELSLRIDTIFETQRRLALLRATLIPLTYLERLILPNTPDGMVSSVDLVRLVSPLRSLRHLTIGFCHARPILEAVSTLFSLAVETNFVRGWSRYDTEDSIIGLISWVREARQTGITALSELCFCSDGHGSSGETLSLLASLYYTSYKPPFDAEKRFTALVDESRAEGLRISIEGGVRSGMSWLQMHRLLKL